MTTASSSARAILLALGLAAGGCSAPPSAKVAAEANRYIFLEARYADVCLTPVKGPEWCPVAYEAQKPAHKALLEAKDALNRGGTMDLQLTWLRKKLRELQKVTRF